MLNSREKREVKCSNICVGRGGVTDLFGQPKFMSIGKEKRRR